MHINFMFDNEGNGWVAFGETLEEDQREDSSVSGGAPSNLIAHVRFEPDDCAVQKMALQIIVGAHALELESAHPHEGTALELLVSQVFKAGMEHALNHTGEIGN